MIDLLKASRVWNLECYKNIVANILQLELVCGIIIFDMLYGLLKKK
jgi:hypothetical protein